MEQFVLWTGECAIQLGFFAFYFISKIESFIFIWIGSKSKWIMLVGKMDYNYSDYDSSSMYSDESVSITKLNELKWTQLFAFFFLNFPVWYRNDIVVLYQFLNRAQYLSINLGSRQIDSCMFFMHISMDLFLIFVCSCNQNRPPLYLESLKIASLHGKSVKEIEHFIEHRRNGMNSIINSFYIWTMVSI